MKICKDSRGFSLVELIITMGIMAILAIGVVGTMGYINAGKTKKASAKLNSKLTYIQSETMTKEGCSYLYLYKQSDGVYCYISNKNSDGNVGTDGLDVAHLDSVASSGDRICDSNVDVIAYTVSGHSIKLGKLKEASGSEADMIKIGYRKSTGDFLASCVYKGSASDPEKDASGETYFFNRIQLSGKQNFSVRLVEKTGKHYVQ